MNSLAQINDTNLKIFDEICAERISAINLDVLNLANIDTLPSDALPHLAEQYHITGEEGWIFCKNEQEKRALLKKAIKLHKYKGTKFAIISALSALNLNCNLEEWFEYHGEPFMFRVFVEVEEVFDSDLEQQIVNIINAHKNVRSWLEALTIELFRHSYYGIASWISTSEEVTV